MVIFLFLCYLGLSQVQLDSVLVSFQSLHHFFFVLYKIFKEGFSPTNHLLGTASEEGSLKFATQGGFLRQPTLDSLNLNKVEVLPKVEKTLWENFNAELAAVAWPTVKKCLHKGKAFIDYRISQVLKLNIFTCLMLFFLSANHEISDSVSSTSELKD